VRTEAPAENRSDFDSSAAPALPVPAAGWKRLGLVMNKGLTIKTGQTHVNRWTDDLLERIDRGEIDPSFVITHSVGLEQGPEMYKVFRDKSDSCIKVLLKP
jgi:threonine dehydrogenase-like Zn-dependent dehydrogenase